MKEASASFRRGFFVVRLLCQKPDRQGGQLADELAQMHADDAD